MCILKDYVLKTWHCSFFSNHNKLIYLYVLNKLLLSLVYIHRFWAIISSQLVWPSIHAAK